MKPEKYTPTNEDIKQAEGHLTPEQRIRSEAREEGFNLGLEMGKAGEEKFDSQPSHQSFSSFETAKTTGRAMGMPKYGNKFEEFSGVTPVMYLLQRTDGNYEVHINQQIFISGRIDGPSLKSLFDIDPYQTDQFYKSTIPAIINLSGDGSFRVISKGEVKQL